MENRYDGLSSIMLAQIQEVEQKDEQQVLAELAGETIRDYIYETEVRDWVTQPDGSRKRQKIRKVKLLWAGTREVARARGNIVLSDPMITETDDGLRIIVKGTDILRNFSVFGGCHQPKKMKVNDYDETTGEITGFHLEDDPFCFQKGLSKAQRNVLQSCIPADYAVKMIDRFLKATGRPALGAGTRVQIGKTQPVKLVKPRAEWLKITEQMVPNYPALSRIIWDLAKLQPKEMYQELGGGTADDMAIPAWKSFLTLLDRYAPAERINQ